MSRYAYPLAMLGMVLLAPVESRKMSKKAASEGDTPGAFTNFGFPDNSQPFNNFQYNFTVDSDPGQTSSVFWAMQFNTYSGSDGAPSGYVGVQSIGGGPRQFIYSLWGSTDMNPVEPATTCATQDEGSDNGEPLGHSCQREFSWQAGVTYTIRMSYDSQFWLSASVYEASTNTYLFSLGSLQTASANKISNDWMSGWTEYFEWSDPASTCLNQPYAQATFGVPRGDDSTFALITNVQKGDKCIPFSDVKVVSGGSTEYTGIGNSARRYFSNSDGSGCLRVTEDKPSAADEEVAISSSPISVNALKRYVVVSDCEWESQQLGWVLSKQGTLVTSENVCLTASSSSSVSMSSCAAASASVPITQQWSVVSSGPRGTYKISSKKYPAQCLSSAGGVAGRAPVLQSCSSSSSSQKWVASLTP